MGLNSVSKPPQIEVNYYYCEVRNTHLILDGSEVNLKKEQNEQEAKSKEEQKEGRPALEPPRPVNLSRRESLFHNI